MRNRNNTYLKIIDNKLFCMAWLLVCVAFITWFACLKVPLEGVTPVTYSKVLEKTVSVIAVTHPRLYYLWVAVTLIAVYLNVRYMYKNNAYEGKTGKRLLYISFVCCLLTIVMPHADAGIRKIIHWSLALFFAFLCAGSIILFLAAKAKTSRRYLATLLIYVAIPVVMITLLIIYGESGAIEILPMWGSCLILFLVNYTGFYKEKPVRETVAAIK